MQLMLKRAKIFMLEKDGKNLRFSFGIGGPGPAPAWVAETGTYKHGIEDGSIINLTEKARAQEAELAREEHRGPEPIIEPVVPELAQGDGEPLAPRRREPQGQVTASTRANKAPVAASKVL